MQKALRTILGIAIQFFFLWKKKSKTSQAAMFDSFVFRLVTPLKSCKISTIDAISTWSSIFQVSAQHPCVITKTTYRCWRRAYFLFQINLNFDRTRLRDTVYAKGTSFYLILLFWHCYFWMNRIQLFLDFLHLNILESRVRKCHREGKQSEIIFN